MLKDLVVVITGASSGIGRATVLEFARQGANVILLARRAKALEELAGECERIGGVKALVIPADVTDEQAVKKAADSTYKEFGHIDVWVNNAAVTSYGNIEEIPTDTIKRLFDTNIMGYVHGVKAVLPYMREQGGGVIINVSSAVGVVGQPFTTPYTVSKYAVRGLSIALDQELADEKDIHVCTVYPGAIDTPLFNQGANFSGRKPTPPPPVLSAQQVADVIVDLVMDPKKEVYVGMIGKIGDTIRSISPSAFDLMFSKMVRKKHFTNEPSPASSGNLFEPMEKYASISGGWKDNDPREAAISNKKLLMAGVMVGGATVLGTVLYKLANHKEEGSEDEE